LHGAVGIQGKHRHPVERFLQRLVIRHAGRNNPFGRDAPFVGEGGDWIFVAEEHREFERVSERDVLVLDVDCAFFARFLLMVDTFFIYIIPAAYFGSRTKIHALVAALKPGVDLLGIAAGLDAPGIRVFGLPGQPFVPLGRLV